MSLRSPDRIDAKLKATIKEHIEAATNPYEIAAYISALGYDPFSYSEVLELSSESKHAVVRSSGASAIANILKVGHHLMPVSFQNYKN